MLIVSSYKIKHNAETGLISIISDAVARCPLCGGELCYKDSRVRKVKDYLGEVLRYLLRRLRCTVCKKLHTELPDTIQPYKHYDSHAIQMAIDGDEQASAIAADGSTIKRWKSSFEKAAGDIEQRLSSVYAVESDKSAPIVREGHTLGGIKSKVPRWLAFVMALLINAGNKLLTQFAFCQNPPAGIIMPETKKHAEGVENIAKTIKDTS